MRDQGSMKRYLLGRASPEERIDLEQRYLSDPGLFEEFTEVENDLIDSYARGQLSDLDRDEFERQYLGSPQRRRRVEFASALAEISREPRQAPSVQKSSFWRRLTLPFQARSRLQWGLAVGAMAMILAVGWLKVTNDRRLQASSPAPSAERTATPHSPATVTPPTNSRAPSSGTTEATEIARTDRPELEEFTIQLTPGISRSAGSEAKVFAVPSKASWIRVRLTLDNDDHPVYAAVVETAEGKVIQRINGLRSQLSGGDKVVTLRLASGSIRAGDYVIRLNGSQGTKGSDEEVDVYSLRIASR
jgi:hypothetical protein